VGNVEGDEMIRELHAAGVSMRQIGRRVGLSAMQVCRIVRGG